MCWASAGDRFRGQECRSHFPVWPPVEQARLGPGVPNCCGHWNPLGASKSPAARPTPDTPSEPGLGVNVSIPTPQVMPVFSVGGDRSLNPPAALPLPSRDGADPWPFGSFGS